MFIRDDSSEMTPRGVIIKTPTIALSIGFDTVQIHLNLTKHLKDTITLFIEEELSLRV